MKTLHVFIYSIVASVDNFFCQHLQTPVDTVVNVVLQHFQNVKNLVLTFLCFYFFTSFCLKLNSNFLVFLLQKQGILAKSLGVRGQTPRPLTPNP